MALAEGATADSAESSAIVMARAGGAALILLLAGTVLMIAQP